MNENNAKLYREYKRYTARGAKWTGIGELTTRVLQFGVSVVLLRLLTPVDFGLITLALVVVKFAGIVIDFGVSAALIQRHDATPRHYNATFTILTLLSIPVAAAVYFWAPVLALALGDEQTTELLQGLTIIIPISTLTLVPRAILFRKLYFRRMAVAEFASAFIYGTVTIIAALILKDARCFVFGIIAEQMVLMLLMWGFSGWQPRIDFAWRPLWELLHFSGNVFATRLVQLISINLLNVLINKFYGSAVLGLFSLAYQLIDIPVQRIAVNLLKVMYPVLSRLQHQRRAYNTLFLNAVFMLTLFISPLYTALYFFGEPFILIFYGPKWLASVPFVKILCVVGFFQSAWIGISLVSMSIGKPQFDLYLNLINTVVFFGGALLLAEMGINPVLNYMAVIWGGLFLFGALRVYQWLNVSVCSALLQLRAPILATLILASLAYGGISMGWIDYSEAILLKFTLTVILSLTLYTGLLFLIDRREMMAVVRILFKSS